MLSLLVYKGSTGQKGGKFMGRRKHTKYPRTKTRRIKKPVPLQKTQKNWWRKNNWNILGLILTILTGVALPFYFQYESNVSQKEMTQMLSTVQALQSTTVASISTNAPGIIGNLTESVNKILTCGEGCPDLLRVRIDTIQFNKLNDVMTWNIHFFDPTGSVFQPSFDTFDLYDTAQPSTAAALNMNWSTGSLQATFPFIPSHNQSYTLRVAASYHTIMNGMVSIERTQILFEPTLMTFGM
jgi:hypothetical protein